MTKTTLLLLLYFVFSTSLSAQFAIVSDEAGFVNVYDEEKEELDRLGSDGVVAILSIDDEWALVDYTKYGDYAASSGYVKKKNLIHLSSYKEIPLTTDSGHHVVLSDGDVSITMTTQGFDSLKHAVAYFAEGESTEQISNINGDAYWGTKSELPSNEYLSISLSQEGKKLELPAEALFNLFNPHLNLSKAYYDEENDITYLIAINGDATGAYSVVWVIDEGEYDLHYIFD